MEYKELANKLGVKNILVQHINNNFYKNFIIVVINDDLVMTLLGKTISFIPLTSNGIGKELTQKSAANLLNKIVEELRKESF